MKSSGRRCHDWLNANRNGIKAYNQDVERHVFGDNQQKWHMQGFGKLKRLKRETARILKAIDEIEGGK